MNNSIIILILLFVCILCSNISLAKEFTDVLSSDWYSEYVNFLSDNNVINGYSDNTFRPNNSISRAEFIKLIVSADKGEEYFNYQSENSFALQNWYDVYMNYAISNGLFTKEIGVGNPNDLLTRKEMIIILGKIAQSNNLISNKEIKELAFNDIKDVFDDSELEYVKYAYSSELISGYEDGSFKPFKNMTRAEVATVIYNFVKKVNQ